MGVGLFYKTKPAKDSCHDDRLGKAEEHFKKSVLCYNDLFDSLEDEDEFKVSIFDRFIQVYKALSDVCIETNRTNEALLVCERGRARALEVLLAKKYNIFTTLTEITISSQLNVEDFQKALRSDSSVLFFDVPILQKSLQTWTLSHQSITFTSNELKKVQPYETPENGIENESISEVVEKSYNNMHVREGMMYEDRSVETLEDNGVEQLQSNSNKRCVYDEDEGENLLEVLYETLHGRPIGT